MHDILTLGVIVSPARALIADSLAGAIGSGAHRAAPAGTTECLDIEKINSHARS
jgi:hypothetical protein